METKHGPLDNKVLTNDLLIEQRIKYLVMYRISNECSIDQVLVVVLC